MKLGFTLSSSDRLKKLTANPVGAIAWVGFLLVCAYVLYLGAFLYNNVYIAIIVPKPVDQQAINARQEKINRQQLNAVKTFDENKQNSTVSEGGKTPF